METKKIINLIMVGLSIATLIFKMNQYSGANEIFIISVAVMLFSLFKYALADNVIAGMGNVLNYFMVGSVVITLFTIVFKNMHWGGETLLVMLSYLSIAITPLILIFQKDSVCVSKQFMIIYSLQVLYMITLMRHNPIVQFLENCI